MVEWKGEVSGDAGPKAGRLEQIENFPVPNFFVITPEETEKLVNSKEAPGEVRKAELEQETFQKLKSAYREVDMSSEIRNASGRARNLVGGQRDGSRVSVRVSADGNYDYFLNVGSSDLKDTLKNAIASHIEKKEGYPALIVQKMVEPEVSGSALNLSEHIIVEAVKGYGKALEEASTVPDLYRIKDGIESRIPEKQEETTLNPMSNELRRKKVDRKGALLKDSQLDQLAEKLSGERYSIKFVYKRGTFYAVDAFPTPEVSIMENMKGIVVSEGEVNENLDYERIETPDDPDKPVIAEKGGASSTAAQKARQRDLPAIFSMNGEPENKQEDDRSHGSAKSSFGNSNVVVTKVLKADRELPSKLEQEFDLSFDKSYIETARDAVNFEGEQAVLDTRRMGKETAFKTLEHLESGFVAMIFREMSERDAEKVVEEGVEAVAVENSREKANGNLGRAERKMILEAARQILDRNRSA